MMIPILPCEKGHIAWPSSPHCIELDFLIFPLMSLRQCVGFFHAFHITRKVKLKKFYARPDCFSLFWIQYLYHLLWTMECVICSYKQPSTREVLTESKYSSPEKQIFFSRKQKTLSPEHQKVFDIQYFVFDILCQKTV